MLDLFECFYLYYPWVLGGQQQYDSVMTIAPEFPGSDQPSGNCKKEEVGTNSSIVTLGGTLAL